MILTLNDVTLFGHNLPHVQICCNCSSFVDCCFICHGVCLGYSYSSRREFQFRFKVTLSDHRMELLRIWLVFLRQNSTILSCSGSVSHCQIEILFYFSDGWNMYTSIPNPRVSLTQWVSINPRVSLTQWVSTNPFSNSAINNPTRVCHRVLIALLCLKNLIFHLHLNMNNGIILWSRITLENLLICNWLDTI